MTILSNSKKIDQIYALPGLDVEESAHGHNYEQVQFSFKNNMHSGNGTYEVAGDTLNFYMCHQIDGQDFDIEHSLQDGEESVVFGNIGPYVGTVHFKGGKVNKIIVESHPAREDKCWTFSAINGLRLMTLDK